MALRQHLLDLVQLPDRGTTGSFVATIEAMVPVTPTLDEAFTVLVDDYRTRCLWFLRADYYPATREERLRVLDYVQRYGDRDAHVRAVNLRRWLSQISNADSAVS